MIKALSLLCCRQYKIASDFPSSSQGVSHPETVIFLLLQIRLHFSLGLGIVQVPFSLPLKDGLCTCRRQRDI